MNELNIEVVRIGFENKEILNNIDEEIFDGRIDQHLLASYLQESNHIMLVAIIDDLVVGQVLGVIHKHPDKNTELYIDDLAVSEIYQRNKIATKLFAALIKFGKENYSKELWVATEPENTIARKFYESLGLVQRNVVVFEGDL